MEVTSTPLGVCTRSRSLALQRLKKQQTQWEGKEGPNGDYLELKSRRLKKLPPPVPTRKRCRGRKTTTTSAVPQEEVEGSFGENILELEGKDRSTRETTPCSLAIFETIGTPGSTTRPSHSSHRGVQVPVRTISVSWNELFGDTERQQQQAFIDKYNFDPVNDCPLPGRFEWVKID
ncbi:cyclin-dependent kinase inhibitor 4-like [Panicum miliaceum]|uniref:Cyclin-dependent kinase inhibitor 4-like n=1 Tax=Panicum miliaceum TaxID=4540 RepID=A0A3L6TID8_PANMI|nr:cyclin-dependent kinase inhibitor 4-like [Panicum miliaceum]